MGPAGPVDTASQAPTPLVAARECIGPAGAALNAHLLAVGDPQRTEMIAEAERAGTNGNSASSAGIVA
jgi:hypothetical protein